MLIFAGANPFDHAMYAGLCSGHARAEALPLLEHLVAEFEKSEHLLPAQKMITELKAQVAAKPST